jgi:hypothetical protein
MDGHTDMSSHHDQVASKPLPTLTDGLFMHQREPEGLEGQAAEEPGSRGQLVPKQVIVYALRSMRFL